MKPLIHKYNLTEKRYEDNRTIEDFEKEIAYPADFRFSQRMMLRGVAYRTMVSGKVYETNKCLYSLSREAIENYLKERG